MGMLEEHARQEADPADSDRDLGRFLHVLAREIANHPEKLQGLDAARVQQLQGLVGGVEIDLDAPLPADDE